MRRKALFLVATVAAVLVTLGFAKWFEAKDRAERMLNSWDICWKTGNKVTRTVSLGEVRLVPVPRDCKVKYTGSGTYEVESSFLVSNNPTPVRYTVLITKGAFTSTPTYTFNGKLDRIDSGRAYVFDGKWDKIRFHGFLDDDFLPLSVFRLMVPKFPSCTELQERSRKGEPISSWMCYP